jgi:DNA-binding NtrC family response regulator
VNCAAVPDDLLENELFGHEPEGFTGARTKTKGKFEQANGGTLFLDEIGDASPAVQAKLLRAVDYGEFYRVGGCEKVKVDIRLITATNRDLRAAMADGEFRKDLYYRLCVLEVIMPPLRERREDIPALARHFISTHDVGGERNITGLSPEAESILCNYDWPGNVRQLKHVIERAIAFASGYILQLEDVAAHLFDSPVEDSASEAGTLGEAVLKAEREFVEKVFKMADGSLKKAAELLQRHPKGLARFLDRLNLSHLKNPRRRYGTT